MKIKVIKQYVQERDEALAKFSVEALTEFVEKNIDLIGKDVVDTFKESSPIVKKATLCKMICNVKTFENTELYEKAEAWLKENKMNAGVGIF